MVCWKCSRRTELETDESTTLRIKPASMSTPTMLEQRKRAATLSVTRPSLQPMSITRFPVNLLTSDTRKHGLQRSQGDQPVECGTPCMVTTAVISLACVCETTTALRICMGSIKSVECMQNRLWHIRLQEVWHASSVTGLMKIVGQPGFRFTRAMSYQGHCLTPEVCNQKYMKHDLNTLSQTHDHVCAKFKGHWFRGMEYECIHVSWMLGCEHDRISQHVCMLQQTLLLSQDDESQPAWILLRTGYSDKRFNEQSTHRPPSVYWIDDIFDSYKFDQNSRLFRRGWRGESPWTLCVFEPGTRVLKVTWRSGRNKRSTLLTRLPVLWERVTSIYTRGTWDNSCWFGSYRHETEYCLLDFWCFRSSHRIASIKRI